MTPGRRGSKLGSALLLLAWGAFGQTPAEGPQDYALVDMDRFPAVGEEAVQRGVVTGRGRFLLRSNTVYRLLKVDRATLRTGYVEFKSGPDGARFEIPQVALRPSSASLDTDADGLSDLGEFVLRTDPNDPDSDDDGINDGAAAQAGTQNDPLLRTGVIASVQLPGTAIDVCTRNDMAAVALGSGGLAITNVFTRMNPQVIGLVLTGGDGLRVDVSGALFALADGQAGLTIIDASDPPAARIAHRVTTSSLGGNAISVAVVANIAFVGLSTGVLVSVDMLTGTVLERVTVSSRPLEDVCIAGDAIYVVDGAQVHALHLQLGELSVSASVDAPFLVRPNDRVVAGGGLLYTVHGNGPDAFSLADPLHPALVRAGTQPQFGWQDMALNGSGLALAAVSPNSNFAPPNDVELYDVRVPGDPPLFAGLFETAGEARAVSVFNGLCYAADEAAGLQVINYIPQDRQGIAPTITLSTNQPALAQAEEGTLLRVTATCQDDVQVRGCELFVDGVRAESDGGFPFEFFLITPLRAVKDTLSVRVRVSDTGGNSTFSDELVIQLTPDATAPRVTRVTPPDAGLIGQLAVVAAFFNEPIDPATVSETSFTLTFAGADRSFGTPDDLLVSASREVRSQVSGVFLTPASSLAAGRYRARFQGLRDLSGNEAPTRSWEFDVYGAGGPDQDGDGLSDGLEVALGLRPDLADTDGDGIPDGSEDQDSDGVPNLIEVALLMDLRNSDSDADGIPDGLEDGDNDRLPDWREVSIGTSRFQHDSDSDGFTDNDEYLRGSDPLDPLEGPLRAWVSGTTVFDRVDPAWSLGRARAAAVVSNAARPGYALGTERATVVVENESAPESISGSTQAKPTSVQNDGQ